MSEKPEVEEAIRKLAQQVSAPPSPKHTAPPATNAVPPPAPAPKPRPASRVAKQVQATEPVPRALPFDPALAARRRVQKEDRLKASRASEPPSVSSPIGKSVVDLAYNPSNDKLREFTIIDSTQARLLPLLDTVNHMFQYVLEVAQYRYDPQAYRQIFAEDGKEYPEQPDCIEHLIHRTAQWQKSRGGKNLEGITQLAVTEKENEAQEAGGGFGSNSNFE